MRTRSVAAAVLILGAACGGGPPPPAALDADAETCRHCRMAFSDVRFAGQIVAPGEEPAFFDDIGCLGTFVTKTGAFGPGAIAYVTDHRSGAWVQAARAIYTRVADLDTPMGSHLIAHADSASRSADAVAQRGTVVDAREIFGPSGPPGGTP